MIKQFILYQKMRNFFGSFVFIQRSAVLKSIRFDSGKFNFFFIFVCLRNISLQNSLGQYEMIKDYLREIIINNRELKLN